MKAKLLGPSTSRRVCVCRSASTLVSRLGSSQRRQIERSLRKAVESVPDLSKWVLVIPMNMTPNRSGRSGEQAWFEDKLPTIAPGVHLAWWGMDWLDGQAAEHPDLVRYVEGPDSQLLERSRLFEKEKDILAGGAKDLHSRLRGLRANVDDISMFWTLDFTSSDGVTTSTLRPKMPDAHLLDPITITPTFSFKTGDPEAERWRARFEQTVAFGGTVDLPAGYLTSLDVDASDEARLLLGVKEDASASEFTFATNRVPLDRHIRCAYQVLDRDGRVLAGFPVFLRERTAGARGATLYGGDAADIVALEVSVPRPQTVPGPHETVIMGDARLNVTVPDTLVGYDIDSLLPVLAAFAAAGEGAIIRFEMPGLGYTTGGPLDGPQFPTALEMCELVTALHRMQQHTGSLLRFPANITNADVRDLHDFVRLLDGETVEHDGGLSLNLKPEAVAAFLETLNTAGTETVGAFMSMTDAMELQVGDLTLDYGHAAFYAPHPKLANRAELEAIAARTDLPDGPVVAQFEPTGEPFRWMSYEQATAYHEAAPDSRGSARRPQPHDRRTAYDRDVAGPHRRLAVLREPRVEAVRRTRDRPGDPKGEVDSQAIPTSSTMRTPALRAAPSAEAIASVDAVDQLGSVVANATVCAPSTAPALRVAPTFESPRVSWRLG